MKNELNHAGYDKEAEYFYKKNQELIEKKRQELQASKNQSKENGSQESFWMVCPKCGGKMAEKNVANILIDVCQKCAGIYFDKGELDTLTSTQDVTTFLQALAKISV